MLPIVKPCGCPAESATVYEAEVMRRNIDRAVRALLDRALTIDEVLAQIERECTPSPQIEHFVGFVKSSERGVARP